MEGNKRILPIPKHKRSKDGPAILGMNSELQDLISVYVNKIRPKFAAPDETSLFIKEDGRGFAEGTIGIRLAEFWRKSEVRAVENIVHVNIRKFISTQTQEFAPEEIENVSRVMSHSRQTAQRSYVRGSYHGCHRKGDNHDFLPRIFCCKGTTRTISHCIEQAAATQTTRCIIGIGQPRPACSRN